MQIHIDSRHLTCRMRYGMHPDHKKVCISFTGHVLFTMVSLKYIKVGTQLYSKNESELLQMRD